MDNLFTKPNGLTKVKYDKLGQPSYNRVGKRATTGINPINNNVVTCRPVSRQDRRDFNLVNISKKERKRNMLNEIQKNKFTTRVKEVVQELLKKLNIVELDDNSICELQEELDFLVASLVNTQEAGKIIDEELLEIYDLLVDIVLDNEEDLDFLNQLFFS